MNSSASLLALEPFGFRGYLFAILVPLLAKTIVAWLYNVKKIIRPVLSLWVHLVAPVIVGAILWLVLFGCSFLVSSALTASILLFGGGLFAILGGFFLGGFLAVFDEAALQEMSDAAQMTGRLLAPMAKAIPFFTRLGYKLSPIKEKYTLSLTKEALQEAEEIQKEGERIEK